MPLKNIPIGVLTDRYIALVIGKKNQFELSCKPEDGIYETIQKMNQNGIRRIPVINNNEIVGLVRANDLMQLLAREINDFSQVIIQEIENEMGEQPKFKIEKYFEPNLRYSS